MNNKELRMKLVCFLLLLGLTSVSASFEMNDVMTSGSPAAVHPESVNVGGTELREAKAASEYDEDRAQFMFHSVMVGFIIVGSVFFIAVALIKAICAPTDEDKKLRPNGSLDVEKNPWI